MYKVSDSGEGTPLAWYPAPGHRNRVDGAPVSIGFDRFIWSSATNGIYGLDLYFASQSLYANGADHRALGLPLRCLSE